MSNVTEDDLRNALIDELAASLPKPLGADEFCIAIWMQQRGVVRSVAESQLVSLVNSGKIERIEEKRIFKGHLVIAYRKCKSPA